MLPDLVLQILTNPWGIFLLLLVGAICGLFVHSAAPRAGERLLGVITRGFLGALAGVWAAAAIHLPDLLMVGFRGVTFPAAWSLLGGIIFMMLFRILHI